MAVSLAGNPDLRAPVRAELPAERARAVQDGLLGGRHVHHGRLRHEEWEVGQHRDALRHPGVEVHGGGRRADRLAGLKGVTTSGRGGGAAKLLKNTQCKDLEQNA